MEVAAHKGHDGRTLAHGALDVPHDQTVLVVQELHAHLCDLPRSVNPRVSFSQSADSSQTRA